MQVIAKREPLVRPDSDIGEAGHEYKSALIGEDPSWPYFFVTIQVKIYQVQQTAM
jgi:hypothetical protein